MKDENEECILCGKELNNFEGNICESCYIFMKIKYPKNKLKEVIKCHKRHAKEMQREK